MVGGLVLYQIVISYTVKQRLCITFCSPIVRLVHWVAGVWGLAMGCKKRSLCQNILTPQMKGFSQSLHIKESLIYFLILACHHVVAVLHTLLYVLCLRMLAFVHRLQRKDIKMFSFHLERNLLQWWCDLFLVSRAQVTNW